MSWFRKTRRLSSPARTLEGTIGAHAHDPGSTVRCLRTVRVGDTDDQRAVSASEDHSLIVWDLKTGKALRRLKHHQLPVWGCDVSPDGRQALSASADASMVLWDLETGP